MGCLDCSCFEFWPANNRAPPDHANARMRRRHHARPRRTTSQSSNFIDRVDDRHSDGTFASISPDRHSSRTDRLEIRGHCELVRGSAHILHRRHRLPQNLRISSIVSYVLILTFTLRRMFRSVPTHLHREAEDLPARLRSVRERVDKRLQTSNQSMKPTAPLRDNFSVLATTPCRGLSLSR